MSDNLISKKELLELTGISYGQLYRWKRKDLIPEEWFIKKSAFTGQETYFPREKILDRIDKIVNMKDGLSLDEIADMFVPQLEEISLRENEIQSRNILKEMTINIYKGLHQNESVFSQEKILFMYIMEKFMDTGDVSLEEGRLILGEVEKRYKELDDKNYDVLLVRKFGVAIILILKTETKYFIEEGVKVVHKENILKALEEMNLKTNTRVKA